MVDDSKANPMVDPTRPIVKHAFFHGGIGRDEANHRLRKHGDFLVRMIVHKDDPRFVISTRWNEHCYHFVVRSDQPKQYCLEGISFPNIPELIHYYFTRREPITVASGCVLIHPVGVHDKEPFQEEKRVQLEEKIGQGAFGDVYRCVVAQKTKNGAQAAIKVCRDELSPKERKRLLSKSRVIRTFSHPNFIQIIAVSLATDPVTITMDLMPRGRFDHYLAREKGNIQWLSKLKFAYSSVSAMDYLEHHKCCQRDIGAHAWLMDRNKTIKICVLKLWRKGGLYKLPVRWTAIESLLTRPHMFDSKSDVWGYGVLLWEIATEGNLPFGDVKRNKEVVALLKQDKRLEIPEYVPYDLKVLMQQCWVNDPASRPNFATIKLVVERFLSSAKAAAGQSAKINDVSKVVEKQTQLPVAEAQESSASDILANDLQELNI